MNLEKVVSVYKKIIIIIIIGLLFLAFVFAGLFVYSDYQDEKEVQKTYDICGKDDGYHIYEGKIYYCWTWNMMSAKEVIGADLKTFEIIDIKNAKDRNNLYIFGEIKK